VTCVYTIPFFDLHATPRHPADPQKSGSNVCIYRPDFSNKIHVRLLKSLSTHDILLAQLWEETSKIDQEAQDAIKTFFVNTTKLGKEIQIAREAFKRELAAHLKGESV
jgi:hypothetical protein